MNALKNITIASVLIVATGSTVPAQKNSLSFEKGVGNKETGADISFYAGFRKGHKFLKDRIFAKASFDAAGTVFGKEVSIIDIGASAITHQGGTKNGVTHQPFHRARAWFYLGDTEIFDKSTVLTTTWSKKAILPIAGGSAKYGLGPFTVKITAGLVAWVEPNLGAIVDAVNLTVGAGAGIAAGITAGVNGGISAGGAASFKVVSEVELVSAKATVVGQVTPRRIGASLTLSGNAIKILVKLVLNVSFGEWKLILVDKTYATWSHKISIY